ncbi:MAG TPA: hypothetical protein VFS21_08410 [Roseiflexaceae bacterium]|nr:hypothetical protein [Roseiflexaceae bacterium]
MSHELDEAVELALHGLEEADEAAIIRRLDKELQQQTQVSATLSDTDNPSPWVLGGEEAGGFGSMAQRFLSFYTDAIHREICNADQSGLRDTYKNLLGGQSTQDQVKSLVPVLINAIGASAALINPAAIAALVGLWLLRTGLDQWCTLPRGPKPAAPTTPASPSAPTAPTAPESSN